MTYVADRFIHDADTHIVEPPDWLRRYADVEYRDRVPDTWEASQVPALVAEVGVSSEGATAEVMRAIRERHHSEEFHGTALADVLVRKQLAALGAFIPEDRVAALDELGYATQLVFNTFSNQALQEAEAAGDLELVRAMVTAHNRAIVDYCSIDARLLPVGYVPLSDLERAADFAREALETGCRALIVASVPPRTHGPTHVKLEPLWAFAEAHHAPVVMHVGGGGLPVDPVFYETGREKVPEFHGGEGTMRSLEVVSLPNRPKQLLAALVYDGVLMRYPGLRIGVHEQGASWFPSFLRELDSVASAFRRSERRLQALDKDPSEYLINQLRLTPYPYENVGWIISQSTDRVCMFSSDYPHHEGSKNPLARFDGWLKGQNQAAIDRFYADNFVDFVGGRVPQRT